MALTEEQKRRGLIKQGYNPDEFDAIEEGDTVAIIPHIKVNPPANTPINAPENSNEAPSALGSGLRHAATSVIPAAGGFATGIGAAALSASPLELVPPPFGQILHGLVTLGGGIAGSMATSALQDQVLPDSFKQQLALDQQVNPLASTTGSILGALPTLRPDVKALGGVGRVLRGSLMRGETLAGADIGNALNVGIGTGIGAGQSIYNDVSQDKPIDLSQLAINSAGGAVLNNPRKWTRVIGGHPNTYRPEISDSAMIIKGVNPSDIGQAREGYSAPVGATEPLGQRIFRGVDQSSSLKAEDSHAILESLRKESTDLDTKIQESIAAKAKEVEMKKALLQPEPKLSEATATTKEVRPEGEQFERLTATKDVDNVGDVVDIGEDRTGTITAKSNVEGSEEWKYTVKSKKEAKPLIPDEQPLAFKELSLPAESVGADNKETPSINIPKGAQAKLIRSEGANIQVEPDITNPQTGNQSRGYYRGDTDTVGLNAQGINETTVPHEHVHRRIEHMITEGGSQKNLAEKWLKIHGWDGESTVYNRETNPTYYRAEEALAERAAQSFSERSKEGNSFKTFAKDLVGSLTNDPNRMMGNKLANDASFAERQARLSPSVKTSLANETKYDKTQEEPLSKEQRIGIQKLYNESLEERSDNIGKKDFGRDARKKSWIKELDKLNVSPELRNEITEKLQTGKLAPEILTSQQKKYAFENENYQFEGFKNKYQPSESEEPLFQMRPAIRDNKGELVKGEQGEKHIDIIGKQSLDWKANNIDSHEKGFTVGDKFYTRKEASMLLGEKEPLQSERLKEMQEGKKYQDTDDNKRLKQLEDYEDRRNLTVQEETELAQLRRINRVPFDRMREEVAKYQDSNEALSIETPLLTTLKKALESREDFKKVKVIDKMPKGFVGDYYRGEMRSLPDHTDTALHETIHKVLDENRVQYLHKLTEKYNKNEVTPEDLKNLARVMNSLGYKRNARLIKDFIEPTNGYKQGEIGANQIEHFVSPAIEELATQASGRLMEKMGDFTRDTARDILTKSIGEDFAEFLMHGHVTKEQYYPKYDKASKTYYQDKEETSLDDVAKPDRFLKWFGSATDKIRQKGTASYKHVGDKLDEWSAQFSLNKGEYVNKLTKEIDNYTKSERDRVDEYGRNIQLSKGESTGGIELTPNEKALYQTIRDYLVNVADVNEARLIKKDPNYWPAIVNKNVVHDLVNSEGNYEQYRTDFIQHATDKGLTRTQGRELLNDWIEALGSRGRGKDTEFNALRKVAGIGLPLSMQDNNLLSRFSRYGNRVAKDLASQRVLEKDPVMQYVLHLPDSTTGKKITEQPPLPSGTLVDENVGANPQVQDALKFMYNDFAELSHPRIKAFIRLLNSSLMGTATALRNSVNMPMQAIGSLNEGRDFKHIVGGIVKAFDPSIWQRSLDTNARQKSLSSIEFGANDTPDGFANMLNKASEFMRKWSGREASEQGERIFNFAVGDLAAREKLIAAQSGNKEAARWLEKHSSLIADSEDLIAGKREATEEDYDKIAKSFVDRVSGTYDARGLPAGAMEGQFAPFLALSRWNIEKANVIYKDVVQEATKHGNFLPLLTYTMSGLLTGTAIKELNEILSGKKDSSASLAEATEMKNKKAQVAAVINLMQMASYGGIVSDIAKTAINPTKARGLSFPLADFIADNVGKNLIDAITAMEQGEDKFTTIVDALQEVIKNTVQSYRVVDNRINNKATEEKNRFRDIRVFNELEGKPVNTDYAQPNKFIGKEAKTFKKETDLSKAGEEIGAILKDYFTRYGDKPEELQSKLKGLKANSYQTMPSLERIPISFFRYLNYVRATQGETKAQDMLTDYATRNSINQVKSRMVPSL